jgi:hypothetical protein
MPHCWFQQCGFFFAAKLPGCENLTKSIVELFVFLQTSLEVWGEFQPKPFQEVVVVDC